MRLSLIAGLGNPGLRYVGSRHNLGFAFLDCLADKYDISWHHKKKYCGWITQLPESGPWLLKPDTYVNNSGDSLQGALSWLNLERECVLVIHDELAFSPGAVRLKKGGGHGGHNGLKDIINKTGSADFWRLRLGIGRPSESCEVSRYVLSRPPPADQELLSHSMRLLLDVFPELMSHGPEAVQQRVNQTDGPADDIR